MFGCPPAAFISDATALASESRGGKASRCIGRGRAHLPFHERRRGGCVAGPSLVAVDVAEHRPCRLRGCGRPPHSRRKCARWGAVDDSIGPGRVFTHDLRYLPPDTRIAQPRLANKISFWLYASVGSAGRAISRRSTSSETPSRPSSSLGFRGTPHAASYTTRGVLPSYGAAPRSGNENEPSHCAQQRSVCDAAAEAKAEGCCTHGPAVGESTVLGPRIERVLDQEPRDKVV